MFLIQWAIICFVPVASVKHFTFQTTGLHVTRQRNVKRSASSLPLVDMKKSDAVAQRLGDFGNAKGERPVFPSVVEISSW